LLKNTKLPAREIALQAMEISSGICVYTNNQVTIEEL